MKIHVLEVTRKERDPYMTYAWQSGENKEIYLAIKGETVESGTTVYFDSPACTRHIASAPGVAIVTYHIKGGSAQWFVEQEGDPVATPGKKNTNKLVNLVEAGDIIEIDGRVAEKVSRAGNKYYKVTHVKRVVPEEN